MSIIFNEICINEEMLPIYIYIYIYIIQITFYSHAYDIHFCMFLEIQMNKQPEKILIPQKNNVKIILNEISNKPDENVRHTKTRPLFL